MAGRLKPLNSLASAATGKNRKNGAASSVRTQSQHKLAPLSDENWLLVQMGHGTSACSTVTQRAAIVLHSMHECVWECSIHPFCTQPLDQEKGLEGGASKTAASSQGAVFALPQVVLQRVGETAAGISLLLLHLLKSCLANGSPPLSRCKCRKCKKCQGSNRPFLAQWPERPAAHQPVGPW